MGSQREIPRAPRTCIGQDALPPQKSGTRLARSSPLKKLMLRFSDKPPKTSSPRSQERGLSFPGQSVRTSGPGVPPWWEGNAEKLWGPTSGSPVPPAAAACLRRRPRQQSETNEDGSAGADPGEGIAILPRLREAGPGSGAAAGERGSGRGTGRHRPQHRQRSKDRQRPSCRGVPLRPSFLPLSLYGPSLLPILENSTRPWKSSDKT